MWKDSIAMANNWWGLKYINFANGLDPDQLLLTSSMVEVNTVCDLTLLKTRVAVVLYAI